MRNVDVQRVWATNVRIPHDHALLPGCSRISDVGGTPHLYTLTRSTSCADLALQCTVLHDSSDPSWTSCNLSQYLSSPVDTAVSLDADPSAFDPILVGLRGGALLSVDVESGQVELVGEVVDEDGVEARSGVLGLEKSPDGALIAVVSPVKIMIMTCSWDLVAEVNVELEEGKIAVQAAVSWRGDGAAFVVSMRDKNGVAYGRVVDRDALDIVSLHVEDISGVLGQQHFGNAVSWQPRVGGFIFVAGPGNSVSVFERNGLRHLRSDFQLRSDEADQIGDDQRSPGFLEWSKDSAMLATLPQKENAIDIYMRSNFQWDRKLTIPVVDGVADFRWDNEEQSVLHVVSRGGVVSSFALRSSHAGSASSAGVCGVVDGCQLRVTALAAAIIPPPMAHFVARAMSPICSVCFLPLQGPSETLVSKHKRSTVLIGMLQGSGLFEMISVTGSVDDAKYPSLSWKISAPPGECTHMPVRHPVLVSPELLVLVETSTVLKKNWKESLALHSLSACGGETCKVDEVVLGGGVMAVSPAFVSGHAWDGSMSCVAALSIGELALVHVAKGNSGQQDGWRVKIGKQVACESAGAAVSVHAFGINEGDAGSPLRVLVTVLDRSGRLEVVDVGTSRVALLSTECTSFSMAENSLLFTTRSHVLNCIPVAASNSGNSLANVEAHGRSVLGLLGAEETYAAGKLPISIPGSSRPLDRGSVIVCSLPDDVRVVLQAPRGNIETVAPRPLLLAKICLLAKMKRYGAAFKLSRQQRVDMNIMVEADRAEFLASVPQFVQEVHVPSHLSVFLTYLRGEDAQVNDVCNSVIAAIDEMGGGSVRFAGTVLTAMVRRRPPELGLALKRVREIYDRSEEEGASALDFLLVLTKSEESLYREALGSYDLETALMVAKASQLDPSEYSEELSTLKGLDENRKRYAIDMKLGRYEAALEHLFACGLCERGSCLALAIEHSLYVCAMNLFTADVKAMSMLKRHYGGHLVSKGRFRDAAVVFTGNGDLKRAAAAYRDGGMWRLALSSFSYSEMQRIRDSSSERCTDETTLAAQAVGPQYNCSEEWTVFVESVAESLGEQGLFLDSASVRWSMLRDLDGAIGELVGAQEWCAAFETVASSMACCEVREGKVVSSMAAAARVRVVQGLTDAVLNHISDLKDSAMKMRERSIRLVTVREVKARMSSALGTPGMGSTGEGDSDVFSSSTALGDGSDITFTSATSTGRSRTSIYSSIGLGRGGRKQGEVNQRKAAKAARKRVRAGHPREEEALVATLKRLVPNEFLRRRLGAAGEALCHSDLSTLAVSLRDAVEEFLNCCRELPSDIQEDECVVQAMADTSWQMDVIIDN